MIIQGVFRANLRVTSKETALEFYKGLKNVLLLRYAPGLILRLEPGQHISIISEKDVKTGAAAFVPAFYDEDGSRAYHYRKYINAYLKHE